MRLKDYTKAHGLKPLAGKVGTSSAYLSQIAHGHRACSEPLALAIERETAGAVTVADLRPQFAALLDACGYRKGGEPAVEIDAPIDHHEAACRGTTTEEQSHA